MAEAAPQTYSSHRRYDPPYHVFTFGVFVVSFLSALWVAVREPSFRSLLSALFMAAMLVLFFRVRGYALRVQDRVIRLEERLRLQAVLPEPLRARAGELSERQLVALRFAPDAELPQLVAAALDETLTGDAIKRRIRDWRPDTFRV